MRSFSLFLLLFIAGIKMLLAQAYNEILGRPTDTQITMSIMFYQPAEVYWEYGASSGVYTATTATYNALTRIPLEYDFTNLLPDTKYYYITKYRASGSSSAFSTGTEHTFHTQRAPGSAFTFTVEADEHLYDYGDPGLYNITLKNEAMDNPDFMLTLGDIFGDDHHPSTFTSYDCDSLHYLYRARLGVICHSIPFYICLGNHDAEKEFWIDSMPPNDLGIWSTLARKKYYANPEPNNFYSGDTVHEKYGVGEPDNYYAWTWGNALFVVLDVYRNDCYSTDTVKPPNWDWTLGLTEYTWLKNTLENSKAQYKFVFAHHVSGEARGGIVPAKLFEWGGYEKKGKDTVLTFAKNRPGWAKSIHQLFVDNGVNIFFQGHDHLFAHEVKDNVIYQEVPMAADSTYTKGMRANAKAYTADTIDSSGHIRVTVSPSCVKVDYVRAFLPKDTLSGINHNREISFSYTIGNCTNSVNEIKDHEIVKAYPNPATNSLIIQAEIPKDYSRQIELINMIGNTLAYGELKSNSTTTRLNITNVPAGLYFVKVFNSENFTVFKIIVCK